MFNLKTEASQLSSANGGVGDMRYVQYSATRDVTGANFPNGSQYIKFSTSGRKWWCPKRSYIRMRCQILDGAGNPVVVNDQIAPNMNLMGNLFQSLEMKINGQVVSRCSDYVAQVDTLHKRLTKSKSWLDSTGSSTALLQPEFKDRQKIISSDAFEVDEEALATNVIQTAVGSAAIGGTLGFLDLATPNQVQFIIANSEILFIANGGTPIPDLSTIFKVGDFIAFNDGAAEKIRRITGFRTTNTANDGITVEGAVANNGAANLVAQVRTISQQTSDSRRIDAMEVIWQPALSLFNIDHALPSGSYELVLNPQNSNSYRQLAIESLYYNKELGGAATNFQFNVVDMYLYVCEVEGPRVDNATYYLDLDEINCQRRDVQNATGLLQEEFTVSPSTYALTLAFQDGRAGSDQSKYSASKLKINQPYDDELKLTRMFLKYAGMNKPQPDADPKYKVASAEDYTVQRYNDSILYGGSYFSAGGSETIEDWHKRGAYYHFAWPKDPTDRSTRVNANYQFSQGVANGTVLLFSHFKKAAMVKIENGVVRDVKVEEM